VSDRPLLSVQIMDLGFALRRTSCALSPGIRTASCPGYNAVPAEVDSAVAREALTTLSSVWTE